MLTLPSDLTPHQLRLTDVEVHRHLHPEQPVEWRWFFERRAGEWERLSAETEDWLERHHRTDRFYKKHPCAQDETGLWQPTPSYSSPGPANNEVAEKMLASAPYGLKNFHNSETDDYTIDGELFNADNNLVHCYGIGPDLPRAILACACDAWGIGVPSAWDGVSEKEQGE